MILILLSAILAGLVYGAHIESYVHEQTALVLLTLILLAFLTCQTLRLKRLHPQRWMVNPVVFASFTCFALCYGVTNVIFFFPSLVLSSRIWTYEITSETVKHMFLVVLAGLSMWGGYWSPLAARFSSQRMTDVWHARLFPHSDTLRPMVLPVLFAVATACRLAMIRLGIFGFASLSLEHQLEAVAFSQFLKMGANMGSAALALAAWNVFRNRRGTGNLFWLVALLFSEIGWGLLRGFKSETVMPLVILGVVYYLATGRFRWRFVAGMLVVLFSAYQVVEPYRAARAKDTAFTGTSVSAITGLMTEATDTMAAPVDSPSLLLTIANRLNYTYAGTFGVRYADAKYRDPEAPAFRQSILMAPLHAWIPRFLWPEKPANLHGVWYNTWVLGNRFHNSVFMGPVTYLYFAGGYLAVVLGFFAAGCLQRILFFLLRPWQSAAAALVFVANLGILSLATTVFSGVLTNLCRELPLLVLTMFLVFRPPSVPPKPTNRIHGLAARRPSPSPVSAFNSQVEGAPGTVAPPPAGDPEPMARVIANNPLLPG